MMRKYLIILIAALFSCLPSRLHADDELPYIQYLPEYMPQAPTAQAIARAIDIPVNPYTGIPNITIPLYTIQVGDISVPISLSYQGGGIRPSQEATCVGLGWVLNAGGAITRTVKCADDFMENSATNGQFTNGFLSVVNWPDTTTVDLNYYSIGYTFDEESGTEWKNYLRTDSEPDIFFYKTPRNSGKFSFKKDKSIVYFDKSDNIKITPPFASKLGRYFYAIDELGTGYCFEEKEKTFVYAGPDEAGVNTTAGGVDIVYNTYGRLYNVADYTSTWYLTMMVSDTNDTIEFEYEDEDYQLPLQEYCRYQKLISGTYAEGDTDGAKYSISKTEVHGKRLVRIKWRGGTVNFNYGDGREDFRWASNNPESLASISVHNMKNESVCYWTFSYDYFNDDISGVEEHKKYLFKRLRLNSVRNLLSEQGAYKFSYYDKVPLPVKNTKNLDYWGFYNGVEQGNEYYCPASDVIIDSYKSPNEYYSKMGILETIEHPTGGISKLHWESNELSEGEKRGGLRIARIEGEKEVSYVYYEGKDMVYPSIYYTEKFIGDDLDVVCKIQPSESVRPLSTLKNGNIIGYSRVQEIFPDSSKILYIYNNETEIPQSTTYPYAPTWTKWGNGVLKEKNLFDESGNVKYRAIYYYDIVTTESDYQMGFKEIRPGYFFFYRNNVNKMIPSFVLNVDCRENGDLSALHTYRYNENLLCTEEVIELGTDTHKTVYKYANDFSDTTSNAMVARNMIGIPVAKWSFRNGKLYKGERAVYDGFNELTNDGNTAICGPFTGDDSTFSWMHLPKYQLNLNTSYGTDDIATCIYDTIVTHNSYTRYGRVRDFVHKGMPITYVWSYQGLYPIAKIKNATYQQYIDLTGNLNVDKITAFEPDDIMEDLDNIGNTRNSIWGICLNIENSSVETCFYNPLIGIVDATDCRGIVQVYDYDNKRRLSSVSKLNVLLQTGELTQSFIYGTNYVSTKSYPTGQTQNGIESIQYYDEWGRPSVSTMQGTQQDGAFSYSMLTYDEQGRQSRSYLPVPSDDSAGEELAATDFQTLSEAAFSGDSYGYVQTSYDALGRTVETTLPGKVWHEKEKSTTVQYLTNTANEVKKYTVSGTVLSESGYYEAGMLDCTVTTDPDGLTIKSYKDLFGNVVLERRAGNFDTYYVYDDYNRLRFVLPPKYQEENNLGYYAYQYEYDGRGRLTKKTLPGCEPVRYWYDNADRLVKMQDGVLAQSGYYRVWTYDALGRQLTQGIERNGALQHYEMLHFYDDYDFVQTYSAYLPDAVNNLLPGGNNQDKKGSLTGTWQRTTDGQGLLTVMGYDDFGYLSKKTVSALDKFVIVSDYTNNLAGDVTEESFCQYRKNASSGNMERAVSGIVEHNYDYLHTRLLTSSVLSLLDGNGNTLRTDTISHLTYDEFGRIKRNNRGGTKADMTYEYDPMHGWLERIKSAGGFEQRLYRETEGNNPRWNGGISAMTWKTNNAYLRRFDYDYDAMNRLTSAEYSQYEISGYSGSSPILSMLPVGMENEDYTSEYGYDKNGNLLYAYRQGVVDDVESGLYYDTMDDYNAYYRGNQKLSVGGTGTGEPSYYGSSSFVDGADEAVEYAYNANGSMTMDLNKGITNIAYDLLGNLKEITLDNDRIIRYVYTADGTRLRTVHLQKKNGVWLKDSTDYYGNLLLKNGAMNKYLFSGGYLSFSNGTANGCHYYIQDYQGSNRMVVNSSGVTEQTTHYYPYGGVIGGIDTGANLQPYKFEGKELDRTYGLDWYDIHARQYDPIVPAWHTIDPQAEKSYGISPYAYCAGDPVNKVDRNGEWIESAWDLFNVGLGIQSFTENIQSGNYWDAVVDAGGILIDAAAVIAPAIPGGVGAGIKAAREGTDAVKAMKRGQNTEKAALNALGLKKNTEMFSADIEMKGGFGKQRVNTIPDAIDDNNKYEIKDVKYQSLTKQIRAEMAIQPNKKLKLIIHKDTKLSKPLQNKIEEEKIELQYIEDIFNYNDFE